MSEKVALIIGATGQDGAYLSEFLLPRHAAQSRSQFARATLIARMDADDVSYPDRLAKQVTFLKNMSVDVVVCDAAVFAEGGELVGLLPTGRNLAAIVADPIRGIPFPHPTWCGRAEWFRSHPYYARLSRAQNQDLLLR
jgi:hypothetical protein